MKRIQDGKLIPTEQEDAIALVEWCRLQKIIIVHIPNEGKRTPWHGMSMKRQGMIAGVSDYFIPMPTEKYHGLWLELKRVGFDVTKTPLPQLAWIETMINNGYAGHVCAGFEAAKDCVFNYLNGTMTI